jgi:hypothetical protein
MTAGERERTRQYILRLDRARATLAEEVEPDVAPVRNLTLEERGHLVARLCASAWAILRSRGDFPRVLDQRDPPAPDYLEKWRAMNTRLRATTATSGDDG